MYTHTEIQTFQQKYPILIEMMELSPVFWMNPEIRKVANTVFALTDKDVKDAEQLWQRFAPFIQKEFPETRKGNGWIESPLKEIPAMKMLLESEYTSDLKGNLYLKCDQELAVAGSVKARGGFYEVLYYAENLAIDAGVVQKGENYEIFSTPRLKEFFSQFSIGVGSTGNLGLSIGIMSAKLGFQVSVYMSKDAKQWKKELLRSKGSDVVECEGDFSEAVSRGRKKTNADPKGYFVDDENSKHLFLGYSTAALRLKKQLDEKGVKVNSDHPLFVYLPCGVGGAPGGITFGLKQVFGDDVHCFFVEPVHSPSVLIGLLTGLKNKVSVQDFGLDNKTEADGLAVGRPSKFASSFSEQLVSGIYTIEDNLLFQLLRMLSDSEGIYVEPSATAGLIGPIELMKSHYLQERNLASEDITHIVWATGGGLVPDDEMKELLKR
ncbi:D-serine ammonia-lyase [Oceanobacillus salinisoli]|uniref:D-serine ammonia-lyase n=1 Tax=Oceanobacillus salinisoli TaxID=2678611 RepID=UPI0012E0EF97|nr:D-serine ammonia-lyase [Oceanobacillus salinisoli]